MDFLEMLLDDINLNNNEDMGLYDLERFMIKGEISPDFNFSFTYLLFDSSPIILSAAIQQIRDKYGFEEKLIRSGLCNALNRLTRTKNDYQKMENRKLILCGD